MTTPLYRTEAERQAAEDVYVAQRKCITEPSCGWSNRQALAALRKLIEEDV